MTFDIGAVPFSRFGSYLNFKRRGPATAIAGAKERDGIVLRTLRGDRQKTDVFIIDLLVDGKPVPVRETAEPAVLRLDARGGWARFCFASPGCIRFQARNVALRLSVPDVADTMCFAVPLENGRWQLNSFSHRASFGLMPLRGQLKVDAPSEKTRAKSVVAEFSPPPPSSANKGGGAVEGIIEEFGSVWPQRSFKESFDDCVRSVEREFETWYRNSPAVPESMEDAGRLAAYVNWSAVVAPEGYFRRPAMLMSKNWMPSVWSWDHCFNAMALSHHNPELAWDQMMIPFDYQDSYGALPDCYNDSTMVRNFVKPPIHGWALRYMMRTKEGLSVRRLKEFYEPLCAWTDWWLQHRDSDRDGVPQYLHGNDSGWDNSSAFDIGAPLESPDLSAFLVVQMDVLAEVAAKIGKKRDGHRWRKRADRLLERLLSHSWKCDCDGDGNGSDGRFVALRSGDHATAAGGDSLVLFMPLILGDRLPCEIRHKLVAGVCQEGRFLTKHGLATESIRSAKYDSDGYWRGPIWAPSTMLLVDALLSCGEKHLAREIAFRFCRTAAGSGFAENFDALTGKPLRDPAYTWTSSVFQILAHDLLRR